MKDLDATITLTATYALANETFEKFQSRGWMTHQTQYVVVKLNAREALRTGYISDDPDCDEYGFCPTSIVLGELKPNLDKVGVLREVLPVFDHILHQDEATEIVLRQMERYDEILALSKAENEKKQKAKPSENSPRVTLVGRYLLTPEALRTVHGLYPDIMVHDLYPEIREQTVLISVDAKEALRTRYVNEKNEYNEFVLCKLEPDLEKEAKVLRGPKIPEFDHILSEEEAAEIVTNEMARYNEVLSVSLIYNNKKQTPAKSHSKKRPVVELHGKYRLTREAHDAALVNNLCAMMIRSIDFNVDAEEAIRTGYATLDGGSGRGDEDLTFSKLEPDLDREGVVRRSSLNEFDHILTASEAATIVTNEMKRYNEVLGLSQKIQELKAKSQSAMVVKKYPIVELRGKYWLTSEAHEAINLYGSALQIIEFNVDAEEAIRTGYATLDGKFGRGDEDSTFSKLEPDLNREGVLRRSSRNEFDHVLTASEAATIVTTEMRRYNKVLTVSKKVQELKAKNQSTAVVLVGVYLLTKETHEKLALSGVQTSRKQHVPVVLDAKEAVRTKYATINECGHVIPLGSDQALFQEIKPNPRLLETIRYIPSSMKEFDHILSVEEATKIVTDEMARFDEALAASKAEGEALTKEREENWAKERATSKALEEERQKSKNAFLAELRCYMPRIVDGDPCVIDSNERGMPAWLEMDGKRIDVRYDLLDSQECEAVKKTLLGEWRKRSDAEITSWIQEHGSPRLKKAVGAGLLSQIRGAYRSERLEIELPEWMFLSEEEQDHIKERLNPSEDEIDAFVEAKKKWPEGNVRLSSVRVLFKAPAFEGWASFLVMKCPFHNALIGRICLHSNENDAAGVEAAETSSKPENPKNPSDEIKEDPLEK
jgi:sulfur transfer protein SufE